MMEWSTLRVLGSSRIFNVTLLLPLVGYFILYNSELIGFFKLSTQVLPSEATSGEEVLSSTALLRLHCIYFGGTLLAIGLLVFHWRCPTEIKYYDHATTFIHGELAQMTDRRISEQTEFLEKEAAVVPAFDFKSVSDEIEELTKMLHKIAGGKGGMTLSPEEIKLQLDEMRRWLNKNCTNLMETYYQVVSKSRISSRIAITILYAVGFILLAIPSLWLLWEVSSSAKDTLLEVLG